MEKVRDMKKHVSVVGILHIVFAVLGLFVAVLILFGISIALSYVQGDEMAVAVLRTVMISLTGVISVVSVLSIIGGIGLFSYAEWARVLIIIMSAINCLNIPIGTAKGVYSIWVLLQDETIKLFKREEPVAVKPGEELLAE
ncbi:MAG: hypothetical protein ACQETA_01095 [Bacteroidota bacterium]